MSAARSGRRCLRITPERLVLGLLVAEGLLWLSACLGWPAWHKGYAVLACTATAGAVILGLSMWFLAALVFRRRFQFGVRLLLGLMVAVAVPCSWLAVEMKAAKKQEQAREDICLDCTFDYQNAEDWDGSDPPESVRLGLLLGDDFFHDVVEAEIDADNPLACLSDLPRLRRLTLDAHKPIDEQLKELASLTQLEELNLYGVQLSDAAVEMLKPLSKLRLLDLSRTRITDKAMPTLASFSRLEELQLTDTCITDAGLKCLKPLAGIKSLYISGTRVTEAGLDDLQAFAELQDVGVSAELLTAGCMRRLKSLPKLRELTIGDGELHQDELQRLAGVPQIRRLTVSCRARWEDLQAFEKARPDCQVVTPDFTFCF